MQNPNRSRRVDETYIRVAGRWAYTYRAIDSAGNTVDFLLSPHRDSVAAKNFLQLALAQAGRIQPRVINVAIRRTRPQSNNWRNPRTGPELPMSSVPLHQQYG